MFSLKYIFNSVANMKANHNWASPREKLSSRFANNKGVDHPHRLINAFSIRFLESVISRLATSEILIIYLVSVSEETGFSLALSESVKTGFVASGPKH